MEDKLKDFPCLYYLEKRIDRKSRIQFFSMLASMSGQTPEKAAASSELFARVSGFLFGKVGYTVEEITKTSGNYFEKPYADCRGFNGRKVYSNAKLTENCCVICPYSHSYLNSCLEHERHALYALMADRTLFTSAVNCSVSDFSSRLALSCTNDISLYPLIPFNAYMFEFMFSGGECTVENLVEYIKEVHDCSAVPDELLSSFVKMQLKLIMKYGEKEEILSDSLAFAINAIRTTSSSYTPPVFVHAASLRRESSSKGKKSKLGSQDALQELVTLFSAMNGAGGEELVEEAKIRNDLSTIINTSSKNNSNIDPESVSDNSQNTSHEEGTRKALEKLLAAFEENRLLSECEDTVSGIERNEIEATDNECGEETLDVVAETIQVKESITSSNIEQNIEEEEAVEITEDAAESVTEWCPADYDNTNDASVYAEEMQGECVPEDINRCESDVTTVSITILPGNEDTALSEEVGEVIIEPSSVPEENKSSDVPLLQPCMICRGASIDECSLSENWMMELSKHCLACEEAAGNGKPRPFHSSALNHPTFKQGCAFCNTGISPDCAYRAYASVISKDFVDIIMDCSDYTMRIGGIIKFIEAAAEAPSIAVECVEKYGIEGLLFYISGTYYFIGGGTTALTALKQLFSDARKVTFFSMNPILVHRKLQEFGLKHAKIESVAVKYSLFVGTNVLLPPGFFMAVGDSKDIYRDVMPQYEWLYKRTELSKEDLETYSKLKKLEWALAYSVDVTKIVLGSSRYIYGTNALNYRFSLFDCGRICREGVLYVVTLEEDCKLPDSEAVQFWEDVAGRLAASSLSCMQYAFLLAISNGISYFSCFEEEAFFDSLMASARAAYKKAYNKEVHLHVTCERYVANKD